jgi:hypothetical protein
MIEAIFTERAMSPYEVGMIALAVVILVNGLNALWAEIRGQTDGTNPSNESTKSA